MLDCSSLSRRRREKSNKCIQYYHSINKYLFSQLRHNFTARSSCNVRCCGALDIAQCVFADQKLMMSRRKEKNARICIENFLVVFPIYLSLLLFINEAIRTDKKNTKTQWIKKGPEWEDENMCKVVKHKIIIIFVMNMWIYLLVECGIGSTLHTTELILSCIVVLFSSSSLAHSFFFFFFAAVRIEWEWRLHLISTCAHCGQNVRISCARHSLIFISVLLVRNGVAKIGWNTFSNK